MASETTYNVVKVQELRAISSATGSDEIIINDVDSIPLETKKITVENFAYAIKDYVLPIASAEILGGIRVGQGLTINPANGVLRNDIYYINDLHDVQVTNPKANQILSFDGVKWANTENSAVTEIIAGDGLSGGGSQGSIIINVNPGDGISINNDRINVNTGLGLRTELDVVLVDNHSSLTFAGNQLAVNVGTALIIDEFGVSVNYGRGLTLFGPKLEPHLGSGLTFEAPAEGSDDDYKIAAKLGLGLIFDNTGQISNVYSEEAEDDTPSPDTRLGGIVKNASLQEARAGSNKSNTITPYTLTTYVNEVVDDRVGDGDLTIVVGDSDFSKFNANQFGDTTIDLTEKISEVAAPAGTILTYAGSATPKGYIKCNGASISKTTYADLFAAIGTRYGGSGNNFRVPDLRGVFVRGWDNGRGLDNARSLGSFQSEQLGPHSHVFENKGGTVAHFQKKGRLLSMDIGSGSDDFGQYSMGPGNRGQKHAGLGQISKSGSGIGSETRPINMALNYCIKY